MSQEEEFDDLVFKERLPYMPTDILKSNLDQLILKMKRAEYLMEKGRKRMKWLEEELRRRGEKRMNYYDWVIAIMIGLVGFHYLMVALAMFLARRKK